MSAAWRGPRWLPLVASSLLASARPLRRRAAASVPYACSVHCRQRLDEEADKYKAIEMSTINRPALYLLGTTLPRGWQVKKHIPSTLPVPGGSFSETYVVEREGSIALLKAIDLSIALSAADPIQELAYLTRTYEFEKNLLELCKSARLTKIVNILDSGNLVPQAGGIIPVPYFILEYAAENVEGKIDHDSRLNTAWLLRILHNATVALWQLHKEQVAHRGLRASAVLDFGQSLYKLTDLGRANMKGLENPTESRGGLVLDPAYATPEMLYGLEEKEWMFKHQAADIYALGNFMFFLFTQTTFTGWMTFYLNEAHRWNAWKGTFADVLPYLVEAYDTTVYHFTAFVEDDQLRAEVDAVLRQLCYPDPRRRGHPKSMGTVTALSVERYISVFDKLARQAEMKV